MFTEAEVKTFLEEKLKFENWKEFLEESKVDFLQQLVTKFVLTCFYENVTWGSLPADDRRAPDVADVKAQILETNGGACLHLNFFLCHLLKHLGYHVHPVAGEAKAMALPRNHLLLIVHISIPPVTSDDENGNENNAEGVTGLLNEELYVVDVGFGRPITGPVNLSRLPYRGRAGGFDFELRFNPDTKMYERMLFKGCAIKGEFKEDESERLEVDFDLEPKEYQDFDEIHSIIFTDTSRTFFLNTLFLFRFISIKSAKEFEFVAFRGKSVVFGTCNGRHESRFGTYSEMYCLIERWFPCLDSMKLQIALSNYDSKM